MSISDLAKRSSIPVGDAAETGVEPVGFVDESAVLKKTQLVNAMSVDVEEHFQVSAFADQIDRNQWDDIPSRVSKNMERILRLFDESGTKATFFSLAWVAERIPGLIRTIAAEGHEVASHGCEHARVSSQTREEFLEDVTRSRKILEDLSGTPVVGYRAPSFSINGDTPWAHEALQEAGYEYSSSIYPINHDHYGMPSAPRFPFRFSKGGLLEIPLTTAQFAGKNLPAAGGGYFRLLPVRYSRWALKRVNDNEKMPAVFYFHPWEVDPGQPRVPNVSLTAKFRHYVNLASFESRLARVLQEFSWGRMDRIFREAIAAD